MIDSHCHLADEKFIPDLPSVVDRARAAGVESALCVLSADESDEIERFALVRSLWPEVCCSAGIHPHRAGTYAGRALAAAAVTRALAGATGAAAIGEIGLDYHYDFAPRDVQREVFAAQLTVAIDLGLPVIIHTREAADDTFAVLRDAGGLLRGVLHCFTGTLEEARRGLDAGLYVSFSGIVTFPRSADLRAVAAFVPDDRVLVETDAPFLAPVPHRGRRNEPAWVSETLRSLSGVRGCAAEVLSARTTANFRALVAPIAGVSR